MARNLGSNEVGDWDAYFLFGSTAAWDEEPTELAAKGSTVLGWPSRNASTLPRDFISNPYDDGYVFVMRDEGELLHLVSGGEVRGWYGLCRSPTGAGPTTPTKPTAAAPAALVR
ncbi:MAG: hypothetical protein WD627_11015 [Actinomycetota bacterium]